MLCYRCQHRLEYIESTEYGYEDGERVVRKEGHKPRMKCGETNTSNYICYMFQPLKPIVMDVADSEKELKIKRSPFDPPFISARSKFVREAKASKMEAIGVKDGYVLRWILEEKKLETCLPVRKERTQTGN